MSERDPRLEQSLERLVARAADRDPDWRDVERRAMSARRRLSIVWSFAALLFVAGATTGFGFGSDLWNLVAGKPVDPNRLPAEERRLLASMSSGEPVLRTEPDSPQLRSLGKRVTIRLLARRGGRAFYVIRVRGPQPRYCTAIGGRRPASFDAFGCSTVPFPSAERPVADFSTFTSSRVDPGVRPVRLAGIAADGVAEVAFVDDHGNRVASTPVVDNTYLRTTGLPTKQMTAIVALDRDGRRVFCEDLERGAESCPEEEQIQPAPAPPPPTRPTGLGPHLQHGAAQGVVVDVYKPGVAEFDLTRIEPRARRLTRRHILPGCLRARFYHGEWLVDEVVVDQRGGDTSKLRVDLALPPRFDSSDALPAPYDGCEIGGLYGHRWNDAFGTRAAVEIPLTANGRHFFNDRASARDLAYFVRSARVQKIRLSADPRAGLAAFARRYPRRVVEIASPTARVPKDRVGFWIGPRTIVFTVTSSTGRRFYVVAERGTLKLPQKNLGDLAYVF